MILKDCWSSFTRSCACFQNR